MNNSKTQQKLINSTSTNPATKDEGAYVYHSQQINDLSKRLTILENQSKPEEDYFKSAKIINKVSLLLFLLLPIIQLITTLVILMIIGKNNDSFIIIAKWLIGVIGVGVLIELIYVPYRLKIIEDKIKNNPSFS